MSLKKSKTIPTSRLSRLSKFGGLLGNIAGQMVLDGATQLVKGKRPKLEDLLLQPKNMLQLADKLAHLRGAAMKLGQIISMDIGEVLPEELADILAVLRDSANPMPQEQLQQVMQENWGENWRDRVSSFEMEPFAAASIGQVHKATAKDGRVLAVKIQYPGIVSSIHSDVDNLGALLKLSRLIPEQMDMTRILMEVKMQLIREADYELEAASLHKYRLKVQSMPSLLLPEVDDELSTERVLAMEYIDAISLSETLELPQAVRDKIGHDLVQLLIAELFAFRLIQSDPNLGNYLYQPEQEKLVLLDFGATRAIPEEISLAYLRLLRSVLKNETEETLSIAVELGFFTKDMPAAVRDIMLQIVEIAAEPLRLDSAFDFGAGDIAARIQTVSMDLMQHRDAFDNPPVDAMFIHRKVGGLYMLLSKIRARVNLKELVTPLIK